MHCIFRKALMIMVIIVCCYRVVAQPRICDQQAICISPADTVINGNSLPLSFEMKNLGPDVMFADDTTLYLLYRVEENGKSKVIYSGATVGRNHDTIGIGQSIRYVDNYGISFYYPDRRDTFTIAFCVLIGTSTINDNGDTVQRFSHQDLNIENNACCKKVTIIPKKSTSVVTKDRNEDGWSVYPNPAGNMLYIRTGEEQHKGELQVTIRDLTGRVMLEQHYNENQLSNAPMLLNVQSLPVGIFSISLQSETGTVSKKISIIR